IQVWLVMRGLGLGLTNIPLQTLVLSVVSNRAMARASSLVTVTRQVAGAIGIAILTTYWVQQTTSHAQSLATPDRIRALAATFQRTQLVHVKAACYTQAGGNIPATTACINNAAHQFIQQAIGPQATVMGLNDMFLITLIGTGVCVLLALLVGRDPAVEAAKKAVARGETVQPRPAIIGE
ncbi:MAG: hypothetical protein ACRDHP_10180, partial [Ktedonobacterales bacterium]